MSPARTKRAAPTVFRNQDTGDKLNRPLADFSDDLHKRLLALENSRKVIKFDTTWLAASLPVRVRLPEGFTPKCVHVGRVEAPEARLAVYATGGASWRVDGDALLIDYIPGLTFGTRYIVTLELTK